MREANELEVSIKKLENVIAELDEKIASKSKEMGDCEKSLKEVTAEYLIKIQQLEDNLAANEEKERELVSIGDRSRVYIVKYYLTIICR